MGVVKVGYSVMGDLKGVQVLQGEGVSAVGGALLWLSLELLPLDRNVTLMYIADVLVPYQTNHTLLVNSSLKFFSIEANPASVNVSMWSPCQHVVPMCIMWLPSYHMVPLPTTWSPCLSHGPLAYHMVPMPITWSPCLSHGPHAYHMVPKSIAWSPCLSHGPMPISLQSNLSEYSGKMYLQTNEGCMTVMVDKVTDNKIAILFVCIISLASLCCLPCLWVLIHTRVTSTHKVAPAVLTQLVSGA